MGPPMPRSLPQPPPSSTVARLLDAQAAARATHSAADVLPPGTHLPLAPSDPTTPRPQEQREIKRELTLSPATDETFTQLIELYRRATGTRLSASHLARALLMGIATCLPALQREAARLGPLKLPGNAPGYQRERQRFEERLARAFVAGMRSLPPWEGA